jgi:hypothetical protein
MVTDRHAILLFEAFQVRLGAPQMRKQRQGRPAPGPSQAVPVGQSPTPMLRAPSLVGTPTGGGKHYKPRKPMSIVTNPTSIKVGGI